MTIEISAKIEGNFEINENPIEVWFKARRCVIYEEVSSYYIALQIDVTNPEHYYPQDFDDNAKIFANFEELEIFKEAICLFQYIESIGAFDFNIEKIYWEQPRIKFIPQTEEEERQYRGFHQSKVRVYNTPKATIDWDKLHNAIIYRNNFEQFNLPFSFYREGNLAFQKGEYRRAFLMHYMMLELFYINENETSHKDTKQKFSQSEEFNKAIDLLIETIKQPECHSHFEWIEGKCKYFSKNIDKDGLIHILVQMRGSLAHGLKKSSNYIFNEKELYTLAYITQFIAMYVCRTMQINCFSTKFVK